MDEKLQKVITRIQGLLAQAASTNFPEEADAFRAKADELMTNYAVKTWQLEREAQGSTFKAVVEPVDISWYWSVEDREVAQAIYSAYWELAEHTRVEPAYMDIDYNKKAMPVVGMEGDVQYFQIIFTDVFRQMVEAMDPHPKRGEPMIEALVRMKEAGMKWEQIFYRLRRAGYYDEGLAWSPSKMDYAGKYTDYCMKHKRPRVRTTPSVYRRSFTRGFVFGMARKLKDQREAQGQNSGSMALDLRDYRKDVKDALYDMFPKHRPPSEAEIAEMQAQMKGSKKSKRSAMPKPLAYSNEASMRGVKAGEKVSIISRGDDSRQRVSGELR